MSALTQQRVDEYVAMHGVGAAICEAVEAAILSDAADPVAFIADFLAQRTSNEPHAPVVGAALPETQAPAAAAVPADGPATTTAPPPWHDDAWAAGKWLSTLGDVTEAIASGLLGPERPHDELAAMRALGAATPSEAALERRLRDTGALGALAKALHPALRRLAEAETLTIEQVPPFGRGCPCFPAS